MAAASSPAARRYRWTGLNAFMMAEGGVMRHSDGELP